MKRSFILLGVMLVFFALLLIACSAPISLSRLPVGLFSAPEQPTPAATFTQPTQLDSSGDSLTNLENAFEQIYADVNPSVVTIDVVQTQTFVLPSIPEIPSFPFFGPLQQQPQRQVQRALGSGFVWDKEGHIVTNNHVVAGADRISVTFSDGTMVAGQVVGKDPDSDLAVLQVNTSADLLHPVQLADSTQVKVGEIAIAIGNPFGEQNTMTTGIISALGRALPAGESTAQGPTYTIPDVIQTDAPINPGNSGGVLLNRDGKVIGVTSAIESPVRASAGVGFAIPSAIVQQVVPLLIKTGHYEHPWLGIGGTTLTPDVATAMGLESNQRGALVIDVTHGSPADKAGLHGSTRQATIGGEQAVVGGDVITAIDGKPTNSFNDVVAFLARNTSVGQTITLSVLRDGKEIQVKVMLAARPASAAQSLNLGI